MTAPVPQAAQPPTEPDATIPVAPAPAPPAAERIPFQDLINAQRAGTLTGRIAPRLYDDFEAGMVAALTPPPAPSSDGGATESAPGEVVLAPSPGAPSVPAPPVNAVPPPAGPGSEYVATVDGRQLTEADLRAMLQIADQAEHLQPMLDTLATGDYVMMPKQFAQQQQAPRAEASPAPIADPIDSMIEEYAQTDPQAAQILRVMAQRHSAETARIHAENASLRGDVEQTQQVQQANGLNEGVAQFARDNQLDAATVDVLATRAGQTGYLPMMMQRRYEQAQASGLPIDHAAIARDAAVELMNFAKAQYLPPIAPQQFAQQAAPSAVAPSATQTSAVPATNPNTTPSSEADIEARVQARLQEELQRRSQRQIHSALAGGSSGTPSLAPTPPDYAAMTPQQRKAAHEAALVNGIMQIQANGGFGH